MKIFDLDSPVMRFLSRVCDLMVINIFGFLLCIPIVTAGASLTAMYTVELKWVRGEEGYLVKPFFRAFKSNFKQATGEWLIILAITLVFVGDFYIFNQNPDLFPQVFQLIIIMIAVVLLLIALWVFPLQCRFINTVKTTFRNAAIMAIANLPRTLGMAACWIVSLVLFVLSLTTQLMVIFPLIFLFCLSLPVFLCCKLFSTPFKRLEPEEEEEDTRSEEEREEEKEEAYRVLREDNPLKHHESKEEEEEEKQEEGKEEETISEQKEEKLPEQEEEKLLEQEEEQNEKQLEEKEGQDTKS